VNASFYELPAMRMTGNTWQLLQKTPSNPVQPRQLTLPATRAGKPILTSFDALNLSCLTLRLQRPPLITNNFSLFAQSIAF